MKKIIDPTFRLRSEFFENYLNCLPIKTFKSEVEAFVTNIFQQHPISKYPDYDITYTRLQSMLGGPSIVRSLFALNDYITSYLPEIQKIVQRYAKSKNLVFCEIGYPGRISRYIKANRIVVYPRLRLFDYIQAGVTRFRRKDNISYITPNSCDVVFMGIGLHHEIDPDTTLSNISRILKNRGILILIEHDCETSRMVELCDLIHSIFNAGTNVSMKENATEIRNFRSLDYWAESAAKHSLMRTEYEFVKPGDPTRNTMIVFEKQSSRMNIRSYWLPVEYFNVFSASQYAAFLEHTPWYRYDFMSDVRKIIRIFRTSYNQSRREYSTGDIITADIFHTALFVVASMIIEYITKSLYAIPLRLLFPNVVEYNTVQLDDRIETVQRYVPFQDFVVNCMKSEIPILKVNGQDYLMVQLNRSYDCFEDIPSEIEDVYQYKIKLSDLNKVDYNDIYRIFD